MKDHQLIDLHTHLGGGVPAPILWEIIHDEGGCISYKDYNEFQNSLTARGEDINSLDDFLWKFFAATERIQSSPRAMEASCYHMVAKAFRRTASSGRGQLAGVEVRFNPMKRVLDGQFDANRIIEAAIRGLTRASSHYGVKTGIIFTMGRDMTDEQNAKVLGAACRWYGEGRNKRVGHYGVVGIDVAGTESNRREMHTEWMNQMARIFDTARDVGLGTTYHVGETADTGWFCVENVIEKLRPDRIGHGIQAIHKDSTMGLLQSRGVTLEICPSVNLLTKTLEGMAQLRSVIGQFYRNGVPFTLCTDNAYLANTNLGNEYTLVEEAILEGKLAAHPDTYQKYVDEAEKILSWSRECAQKATFLAG